MAGGAGAGGRGSGCNPTEKTDRSRRSRFIKGHCKYRVGRPGAISLSRPVRFSVKFATKSSVGAQLSRGESNFFFFCSPEYHLLCVATSVGAFASPLCFIEGERVCESYHRPSARLMSLYVTFYPRRDGFFYNGITTVSRRRRFVARTIGETDAI